MKIDQEVLKDLNNTTEILALNPSPVWVKTAADILRRIADDLDRQVNNSRPDLRQP